MPGTNRLQWAILAFIDGEGNDAAPLPVNKATLFDGLTKLDFRTQELLPAAADSWEVNDDATVWTFHLRPGATFHHGRPVVARDFKYAWERICHPSTGDQEVRYLLFPVMGFDEFTSGAASELAGVTAIDDLTLQVRLKHPFADFEYVTSQASLGPVPEEVVEKDPGRFARMPLGNGAFLMPSPWNGGREFDVVRFDQYYGAAAHVEGIHFKIFGKPEEAFEDFKSGSFDFSPIAKESIEAAVSEYGESEDGVEVSPGKQVLLGPETGVYYLLMNNRDPVLQNADVRRALSLAIDRQRLCDTIYGRTRRPATNMIPEGIPGYEPAAWPYTRYDPDEAKRLLARSGLTGTMKPLKISLPGGFGHEDVIRLIAEDLARVGIAAELDPADWPEHMRRTQTRQYQLATTGWIADFPTIDSFVYFFFTTTAADGGYWGDPAIETAVLGARKTVDHDERTRAYQAIVRSLGQQVPLVPLLVYCHFFVGSSRLRNLVVSPQGLCNFADCWIAE